jgi:hypothetical protein
MVASHKTSTTSNGTETVAILGGLVVERALGQGD